MEKDSGSDLLAFPPLGPDEDVVFGSDKKGKKDEKGWKKAKKTFKQPKSSSAAVSLGPVVVEAVSRSPSIDRQAVAPKPSPRAGRRARKAKPEVPPTNPIVEIVAADPAPEPAGGGGGSPAAPPPKRSWAQAAYSIPEKAREDTLESHFCREHSIPVNGEPVGNNTHALAALERRVAIRYALGLALDKVPHEGPLRVKDAFGNDRTKKIVAEFERLGANIELHIDGEILVPADVLRRAPAQSDDRSKFDVLLFVNVYALGDQAFSPANLATLMKLHSCQYAVIVNHIFPEALGTVARTGCYKRVFEAGRERVIARPSIHDRAYGPHDPCDWLLDEGYSDGISWTKDRSIGDSHVFFVATTPKTQGTRSLSRANITWTTVDIIDSTTWHGWTYSTMPYILRRLADWLIPAPRLSGVVPSDLVAEAKRRFAAASINKHTLRAVTTAIQNKMDEPSRPFKLVSKCFPDQGENMARLIVSQAIVELAHEDTAHLSMLNLQHGGALAARSHELNALGAPPAQPSGRLWYWAAGAIVGYPLLKPILVPWGQLFATLGVALASYVSSKLRPLSWATRHPVHSAVIEEAVRAVAMAGLTWAFPAQAALTWLIPVAYTFLEPHFSWQSLFGHMMLHGLALASPILALATHVLNNAGPPTVDVNRWEQYKSEYLECSLLDMKPADQYSVACSAIPVESARVLCRQDAVHMPVERSQLKQAFGLEELTDEVGTPTYWYVGLGHNAPISVPGNSDQVARRAIEARILNATPLENHPAVRRSPDGRLRSDDFERVVREHSQLWKSARKLMEPYYTHELQVAGISCDEPDREEAVEAFIAHLGPHNKEKLVNEMIRVDNRLIPSGPVKLIIKKNEKLGQRGLPSKVLPPDVASRHAPDALIHTLKARTIAAVSPTEIAAHGPEVFVTWGRIKAACHADISSRQSYGFTTNRGRQPIVLIYGPLSDVEMATAATRLRNSEIDCIALFVAGDDSATLVVVNVNGQAHYFSLENDFSQYDASQFRVVQKAPVSMLAQAGLSREKQAYLLTTSDQGYVYHSKHSRAHVTITLETLDALIAAFAPTGDRKTGGAETTPGNGGANAASTVQAYCDVDLMERLRECVAGATTLTAVQLLLEKKFLDMGLKCKMTIRQDFVGTTFLKHVLLPAERDLSGQWHTVLLCMKLDSQILKLGSCLRDPREIYHDDLATSLECFLRDSAMGLVDNWVGPNGLLDIFRAKYCCLHQAHPGKYHDREDAYRVRADTSDFFGVAKRRWRVSREAYYSWGRERYGDTWTDIELLAGILSAAPYRAFLEHPLFEAMVCADYA